MEIGEVENKERIDLKSQNGTTSIINKIMNQKTIPVFNKYSAYKDSGVEWLGEIPEHWEVEPGLRFITENKSKNTGMIRNTILSLSYGKIRVKQEDELTGLVPESFETYQIVNKGDLIFRPTDLQNDKVSLRSAYSDYDGIITNAYLSLKFKEFADSKFFHYFFRAIDNNKIIYGLGSGLRQNISFLDFRRFLFPFPPFHEQTAIATFLDNKTAKIDHAIAQKEKMISLLKERKQIIIQDLITGKKVWNETLNTWTEPTELKDSGVEWIGDIPAHWEVKRLRNLFRFSKGLTITKENLQDDGIPCVSYGEIHSKYGFEVNPEVHPLKCVSEEYLRNNQKSLVNQDDFIFADTSEDLEGSGNFTYLNFDGTVFAGYHTIIGKPKNQINSRFLAYVLDSFPFRNQVRTQMKGVKVYSITQSILKNLICWFPKECEQTEIAKLLDSQSTKIDKAITIQEQQIEKLKELKSTLIDSAVTGKIKVS